MYSVVVMQSTVCVCMASFLVNPFNLIHFIQIETSHLAVVNVSL